VYTASQMYRFEKTDSTNTDFLALVAMLDADLYARYGDLQNEYEQFNDLSNINTALVAYQGKTPVGCCCFKKYDADIVEMKRVFVVPESRKQGIATQLIALLEDWAAQLGFQTMILETGDQQPESVCLYKKLGYQTIPNYRMFIGMEHSICMQKTLQQTQTQ
jgi:putative acetyltransferase